MHLSTTVTSTRQAIRHNIQSKGLQTLLKHSTKFMYLVKMIYGLACVPTDLVTEIFDMDFLDNNGQEEVFDELSDELEDFIS
jgi:hypothetical protein